MKIAIPVTLNPYLQFTNVVYVFEKQNNTYHRCQPGNR